MVITGTLEQKAQRAIKLIPICGEVKLCKYGIEFWKLCEKFSTEHRASCEPTLDCPLTGEEESSRKKF
jgi:hypothetical protein